MGKKKFIDKKKAATFQLLARDTSDPNYESGPSGDRVFVRIDNNQYNPDGLLNDESADAVPSDDPDSVFAGDYDAISGHFYGGGGQTAPLPDQVRREIIELGFPDDGYNYLTHLREIKNMGGGSAFYQNPKARLDQLPRDFKAYDASRLQISKVSDESSNEMSIYNVASRTVGIRTQKAVDPEVTALLDDSDLSRFGSEVEEDLEEDFVAKANVSEGLMDIEMDQKLSLNGKLEDNQLVSGHVGISGFKEKMSTSVETVVDKPRVRRHLDEQFDLLELQEYGSDNEDEYDGNMSEENGCQESLAEKLTLSFKDHGVDSLVPEDKYKILSLLHDRKGEDTESLECAVDVIQRCMEYAEKYEMESQNEEVVIVQESSSDSEAWDCETIVSTYSNLDNHPGKIESPAIRRKKELHKTVFESPTFNKHLISLKGKTQIPMDIPPRTRKPASEKVKDVDPSKSEPQKKKQLGQESKEEKKERKAAVKEERREARRLKKEMKGLYRSEAKRAQKVAAFTMPASMHLM